ncbi:MAG: BCCT family transporter [Acetivibrio ethanolgignens]
MREKIDITVLSLPFLSVIGLCIIFVLWPGQAVDGLFVLRGFLGNELGWFYLLIGLGVFLLSMFLAFSNYGKIRLGDSDKPEFSNFKWGAMIFTSTMAADILYYSCIEWALYGNESRMEELGGMQLGASTYPLFHWGPIPWSFYIVLAVAFGFMLHVRKRTRQCFSEACRPILGRYTDGPLGKGINLLAVFALLAGTATTFSLATPLLAEGIGDLFRIENSVYLTIGILILVAVIYTFAVMFGMRGISIAASMCTWLFFGLIAWVLFAGGEALYIVETGISAIGNLMQNFIGMATFTDPLRETGNGVTGFVQDWTVFYWAYWLVWCVATPFFIGVISKGRTIRNVVLGGYISGLAGTFTSFIVFGNYGLAQQMKGRLDVMGNIAKGVPVPTVILEIFHTLPGSKVAILLLIVTMLSFYSTTFDSLTMVISCYSYKKLPAEETPDRKIRAFWSIIFIILPIGLIFSENSMNSLQSLAIIAAFPITFVLLLIMASFFKDVKQHQQEQQ